MKRISYLLLFIVTSVVSGCTAQTEQNQDTEQQAVTMQLLDCDAFETMISNDTQIQLIDVRTPEEYQSGYIAHAQNIDIYDPAFEKKMNELDKDKPVMVYCAAGGRSANAAERLKAMGFKNVSDLEGGIRTWKSKGKSVTIK